MLVEEITQGCFFKNQMVYSLKGSGITIIIRRAQN